MEAWRKYLQYRLKCLNIHNKKLLQVNNKKLTLLKNEKYGKAAISLKQINSPEKLEKSNAN